MPCLHETHLPSIVLRYIFYCEMIFTSRKRVSCKHGIKQLFRVMTWSVYDKDNMSEYLALRE